MLGMQKIMSTTGATTAIPIVQVNKQVTVTLEEKLRLRNCTCHKENKCIDQDSR